MTFEIPMALPSVSNIREHWRARAKRVKKQRIAVGFMWHYVGQRLAERERLKPPVVVTLTRVSPRLLDSDNLQGAFKAVRDQVAAEMGCDDSDPRVTWVYEQRKGKPSAVVISVEAAR